MSRSAIISSEGKSEVECVGMEVTKIKISLICCQRCPNHLRVVDNEVLCNFKSIDRSIGKIHRQLNVIVEDLKRGEVR